MNNKGFTLIELIGVVAILMLILVVSIPAITSTLTTNTVKKVDSFHKDLEISAQTYVEANWNYFKSVYSAHNRENKYCLSVSTLINNDYIKRTEIDPETNEVLDPVGKYILLEKVNGTSAYRFSYTYVNINDENDSNAGICVGEWE